MFDPVPSYEPFSESAKQELNDFHARVMNYSEYYGVDYSNRFRCIITVCESLVDLRKSVGRDVWKRSEKEPSEDFQNLFQLLIYALGDQGLLYDQYGFWKSEPDIDCWEQSDRSYTELALAMRMRNFTYLRLQKLRNNLKSHADLQHGLKAGYTKDEETTIGAAALMLNKTFPSVNNEICVQIIESLLGNHLFKQAAPLYLFFSLLKNDEVPLTAARFRTLLKQNASDFPPQKRPQQIRQGRRHYQAFQKCVKLIGQIECLTKARVSCFDPFFILSTLRIEERIECSDEQLAIVANLSLNLPKRKTDIPSEIADIKLGEVPIMDIMDAFSRILIASNTRLEGNTHTLPRALKKSIQTLNQVGIGRYSEDKLPANPDCFNDEQYDTIMRRVLYEYGPFPLSLSKEAFWLITGYVPPVNFCPEDNPYDLYSLCYRHLRELWEPYYILLNGLTPQSPGRQHDVNLFDAGAQYSNDLYQDALKAKSVFAAQWDTDMETQFLEKLQEVRDLYFPCLQHKGLDELRKHAQKQYEEIKDKKTSFKSFDYAPDVMSNALLVECFSLTGLHLHQIVFDLLASLNQWLWPL